MKKVKIGSKWWGSNNQHFVVTNISNDNTNTWIHYKELNSTKEFSCYLESFLSRFTETPK